MGQRLAAMSAENLTLRHQLLASSASPSPSLTSPSSLVVSDVVAGNPPLASPPSSSSAPSSSSSMVVSESPNQSPLPQLPGLLSTITTTTKDSTATATTTVSATGPLQQQLVGSETPPVPVPAPAPMPSHEPPQPAMHSLTPQLPSSAAHADCSPQASHLVALPPQLNPLSQSATTPAIAAISSSPTAVSAVSMDLQAATIPVSDINEVSSSSSPPSSSSPSSSSSSSSSPPSSSSSSTDIGRNAVVDAAAAATVSSTVVPTCDNEGGGEAGVHDGVVVSFDNNLSTQSPPQQQHQQQQQPPHPLKQEPPHPEHPPSLQPPLQTTNADTSSSQPMPPPQSSSSSSSSSSSLLSLHKRAVVVDLSQCMPVSPSTPAPTTPFFSLLTTNTLHQQTSSSSGLTQGPGPGLGSHLDQSFAHINRVSRLLDALRLASANNAQEQESGWDASLPYDSGNGSGSINDSKVVVLEAPSLRLALSMLADEVLCLQQQLLAVGEAVSRLGPASGQRLGPTPGQGLEEPSSATNSSRARAIYEERLRCHEER